MTGARKELAVSATLLLSVNNIIDFCLKYRKDLLQQVREGNTFVVPVRISMYHRDIRVIVDNGALCNRCR